MHPRFVGTIPQTWTPWVILLILWPSYLKLGLLELCSPFCGHQMRSKHRGLLIFSSFCGHHSSNMVSSIYSPSFVAIIPQTGGLLELYSSFWPSYLKLGLLELCSSFCGHYTSNMASSIMLLVLWPHSSNMASSSYAPRFVATYLKHGLLDLCSSFCDHHSSNMASSSFLLILWPPFLKHGIPRFRPPSFVAIIPQTWPPGVMLLACLWPPFLKHGLLELCSSLCGHHTSQMASSSYTPRFVAMIAQTRPPREYAPRFVAIISQTWPPRVMTLVDTIPQTWFEL